MGKIFGILIAVFLTCVTTRASGYVDLRGENESMAKQIIDFAMQLAPADHPSTNGADFRGSLHIQGKSLTGHASYEDVGPGQSCVLDLDTYRSNKTDTSVREAHFILTLGTAANDGDVQFVAVPDIGIDEDDRIITPQDSESIATDFMVDGNTFGFSTTPAPDAINDLMSNEHLEVTLKDGHISKVAAKSLRQDDDYGDYVICSFE